MSKRQSMEWTLMRIRSNVAIAILVFVVGTARAEAQCSTRSPGLRGNEKAKPVFSLTINPPSPEVKQGNAVIVTVVYMNTSEHLIILGTVPLDSSTSIECFEIRDAAGNKVESRMPRDSKDWNPEDADSGSIKGRFMGPGEQHESPVDLTKYYKLAQAGTYSVQFFRWSPEGRTWVGSNKINFSVLP